MQILPTSPLCPSTSHHIEPDPLVLSWAVRNLHTTFRPARMVFQETGKSRYSYGPQLIEISRYFHVSAKNTYAYLNQQRVIQSSLPFLPSSSPSSLTPLSYYVPFSVLCSAHLFFGSAWDMIDCNTQSLIRTIGLQKSVETPFSVLIRVLPSLWIWR